MGDLIYVAITLVAFAMVAGLAALASSLTPKEESRP
jgi:hypothetical protein